MEITELFLAGSPMAGLVVVEHASERRHVTEGDESDDQVADDRARSCLKGRPPTT